MGGTISTFVIIGSSISLGSIALSRIVKRRSKIAAVLMIPVDLIAYLSLMAFVLLFSPLLIPFAWLADQWARRNTLRNEVEDLRRQLKDLREDVQKLKNAR